MYQNVFTDDSLEIVAACEEDAHTRHELNQTGNVTITHDLLEQILNDVDCDVIAVGVTIGLNGKKSTYLDSLPPSNPEAYLKDFLDDVAGNKKNGALETKGVCATQRFTPEIQRAVDSLRK